MTRSKVVGSSRQVALANPHIRSAIFSKLRLNNVGRAAAVSKAWADSSVEEKQRIQTELRRLYGIATLQHRSRDLRELKQKSWSLLRRNC